MGGFRTTPLQLILAFGVEPTVWGGTGVGIYY